MFRQIPACMLVVLLAATLLITPTAQAQTTWYVDDDAPNDPGPGDPTVSDSNEDGSPDHPFDAIQEGIDAASDGDTVLVLDGTYTGPGNRDLSIIGSFGVAFTICSVNGPAGCIVDCEHYGGGFYFQDGWDAGTVVDGFTVTNGVADSGAGVCCYDSNPTIVNCTITNNIVTGLEGGGIWCDDSSPTIANCTITGNQATCGGGICCDGTSSPQLIGCTIAQNTADYHGGGICIDGYACAPSLVSCTFRANTTGLEGGGGVYCGANNNLLVVNCVIIGNQTDAHGGGLQNYGDAQVVNCTFAANEALQGGGLASWAGATTVFNSIFWENHASQGSVEEAQIVGPGLGVNSVNYSCVQGWTGALGGIGNIPYDPRFVDADDGNLRLRLGSPCLDAGNNGAVPLDTPDLDGDGDPNEPLPYDLDGSDRFVDNPTGCDNGAGDPPLVDMGAYEAEAPAYYFVVVSEPCPLTVPEGSTADFTVALSEAPSEAFDAIVSWEAGDLDLSVVDGSVIAFDPNNWPQPHTVSVGAGPDNDAIDGSAVLVITSSVGAPAPVEVTVVETDDAPFALLVIPNPVFLPEGHTRDVGVQPSQQPDGDVTVTVAFQAGDPNIVIVSGETLYFSPGDWDENYVQLLAIEDEVSLPGTATFLITADTPGVPNAQLTAHRWDDDASRLYVDDDAPPPGDGLSWATAYVDLQDALAHAAGVLGTTPEIRVGQGMYKPDSGTGDSAATFQLISGVGLYGGYRGTDPNEPGDPNDHDPNTFQSTLSGDLLGDDGPPFVEEFTMCYSGEGVPAEPGCEPFDRDADADVDHADLALVLATGNYDDNSCHVVTGTGIDATAVLDGFTITAGYADLPYPDDRGGGLHNHNGDPTVANCKFVGNYGHYGAGISNESGSTPIVMDSVFRGNLAWEGNGAGIDNNYSTHCTVVGCVFRGNTAAYCGGGISSGGCAPDVMDCTFIGNAALSLDPYWEHDGGGALFHWTTTSVVSVRACIFVDNMAFAGCGGAVNNRNAAVEFINCAFHRNWATEAGGGMFQDYRGTGVINCVFAGNEAGTDGGGLHICHGAIVSNCTIAGNVAGNHGGGICPVDDPAIANTILWGNTPENVDPNSGDPVIEYCNVEGGWLGEGNIDADPLFERDPNDGGDGWGDDPNTPDVDEGANDDYGDLRLQQDSPCIDAAENAAVPADSPDLDGDGDPNEPIPFDRDGRLRFADCLGTPDNGNGAPPIVDMGAYEHQVHGDLDGDGLVGLDDLAQLIGHYGSASGASYGDGDIHPPLQGDDDVDLADLAEMVGAYGTDTVDCLGDLTGDDQVNLDDLAQLVGNYGTAGGATYTDGDLDLDGDVDLDDLAALLGVYGTTCQ